MAGYLRPLAYLTHVSERCRQQVADPSTALFETGLEQLTAKAGAPTRKLFLVGSRAVPFFLRANNSGVFV
jgi:hypothetical protein